MLHPDMQILKILQLINNRYLYLEPTVHEPVNRNILIYSFLSLSLSLPLSLFSEPLDSLLFETLLSQLFTCSVLEGFVWIFLRFFFFFGAYGVAMVVGVLLWWWGGWLPWLWGVAVVVRWRVRVCGLVWWKFTKLPLNKFISFFFKKSYS